MTDDERAVILAEARANVERLADLRVEHRDHDDDAVTQWARRMPKSEPPKRQRGPSAAELEQLRARQWTAFVDTRIAHFFAQHDKVRLEAMGTALGMMRKQLREEIAAEVGQLRAEVTLQRAHAGARDSGEVIDLPWPRRRSDAA